MMVSRGYASRLSGRGQAARRDDLKKRDGLTRASSSTPEAGPSRQAETLTWTVCQPVAPLGNGLAAAAVCVYPVSSVARTWSR